MQRADVTAGIQAKEVVIAVSAIVAFFHDKWSDEQCHDLGAGEQVCHHCVLILIPHVVFREVEHGAEKA